MLVTTPMERSFIVKVDGKDVTLPDPDRLYQPRDVRDHYSGRYPILTNATIDGPKVEDDKLVYRFASTIGTKG